MLQAKARAPYSLVGRRVILYSFVPFLFISSADAQDKINYTDQILALVEANCAKCHNSDKKKADLDLTSYQGALKGSGSGVIVLSGNPDGSKLWKALTHAEEPFMPPNRPKLPDKELELFKKWIAGGLLETAGGQAIAAAKSGVDLSINPNDIAKPEGPPPMPQEVPLEPVTHTRRMTAVTGLAASPWAPLVAIAGQKQVLLFQSDSMELLGILPFEEGQPVDVKFSRSGKLLLAAGGRSAKSGRVVVWDVVTGERLMTIGQEYDTVLAADIRPDQTQIALGGPSRLLKIYSTKTGEVVHKLKKHTDWVTAVAFSPNGQMLASGDRNGGITLWDPESGQELFTFPSHKSAVTALSWRPDSKLLASSSEDGTVKLWETKEGKSVKSWTAHGFGALCVSYASDGHLVTCGRDNAVTLWDANGSKVRSFEFFGNIPLRAAFNQDNTRIFATDFAGRAAVWAAADAKRVSELDPNPMPLAEQLAAAQKRLNEVQGRAAEAAKQVAAAEKERQEAAASLEAANRELEAARSALATNANTIAASAPSRTNAAASSATPSTTNTAGIVTSTTTNSNEAVSAAMQTVVARSNSLAAAQSKLAKAQSEMPDAQLAEAKNLVTRLQSAQLLTSIYRLRADMAASKREQQRLAAVLDANQHTLEEAQKTLETARQTQAKAEAQIKTAKAETARNQPLAQKLKTQVETSQAQLDKLLQQYKAARGPTKLASQAAK
jgi:WD40 repeat protein